MTTPIVCLLPVRNGERELPEYLECVSRFADAVVALDDGSTDGTRAVLEASPLVTRILENPRRATSAGWDDSANRNRLLRAASDLDPIWIVSLDIDERIDVDDAEALRRLALTDALPACAYAFRHYRVWKDVHDPRSHWIYRMFAFQPDQEFPKERLHFDPIPTSIPRSRWLRTSIRVRHLAAADEARIDARLAKYDEADPDGEYPVDFGGLHRPPLGELRPWEPRDPEEPVLLGPREPWADLLGSRREPWETDAEHELVCLLPVRNGERDLRGYLESVSRFADAVVALDDGSTDGTRAILDASPLVKVVLENPPRATYAGWDDAANRARLLDAAGELRPRWVMWLDVDERIDPSDAGALREFVRTANPDLAYQFLVHRMIDDDRHFDRADLWVCRLFAYEPGQSLPKEQLHLVPIPESIPRSQWIRTTLRIQHLAGMSEERRAERYAKYQQADPERAFQPDYEGILTPPGELRRWAPRPAGLPVLVRGNAPSARSEVDLDAPVLSAVVISRDDEGTIERTVRSVVEQEVHAPFEVIVVVSGTDRTAEVVRRLFPDVELIELEGEALPGAARNAGVNAARGDYVSFPGSHVTLPPGSLAARVRAHELGYPMVTGSVLNGTRTAAGWASYFLDHSTALPGRPPGELRTAPAHCSYARDFLDDVGGFPEHMRAGEDTVVNRALFVRGLRAYRASDVVLVHHSPCRDPVRLVRHHFERGRAFGRILLRDTSGDPRMAARSLRGYLRRRLGLTSANVRRWGGDLRPVYGRVYPLVVLGAGAALAGALSELGKRRLHDLVRRATRVGATIVIAGVDRKPSNPIGNTDVLLLLRVTPFGGPPKVVSLPRDLYVHVPGRRRGRLNGAYYEGAHRPGQLVGHPRGGMTLLRRTLQEELGVRTDDYVLVDFDGFRALVDQVGGVEVEPRHDIDDEFTGWDGEVFAAHFRAGRQRLTGEAALRYARTRHADGDVARRNRHVEVAFAFLREASAIRSPVIAARVLATARRSVLTGRRVWPKVALAISLLRGSARDVRVSIVDRPLATPERLPDGRWVTLGDLAAIGRFVRTRLGGAQAGAARTETGGDQPEATPASFRSLARNR